MEAPDDKTIGFLSRPKGRQASECFRKYSLNALIVDEFNSHLPPAEPLLRRVTCRDPRSNPERPASLGLVQPPEHPSFSPPFIAHVHIYLQHAGTPRKDRIRRCKHNRRLATPDRCTFLKPSLSQSVSLPVHFSSPNDRRLHSTLDHAIYYLNLHKVVASRPQTKSQ